MSSELLGHCLDLWRTRRVVLHCILSCATTESKARLIVLHSNT
jgi:hypothetical protein